MNAIFTPADILLPDFDRVDGTRYAVIACDQFTSEKDYWDAAYETVGDAPSALSMVLPEIYLSETEKRLSAIHAAMQSYEKDILRERKDAMIYLRRVQSDGKIRHGIIGKIDLEAYDYNKGSQSPVRATEGTVLSRIPPRAAVRREATLELPHAMLLIDDKENTVFSSLTGKESKMEKAYAFDLMLDGGSVEAYYLTDAQKASVLAALEKIAAREGESGLCFAVGDGNHSLATAKAIYEEEKQGYTGDTACLASRYALCEVVNLHDDALVFEPIYRVVFHVDPEMLLSELRAYLSSLKGAAARQTLTAVGKDIEETLVAETPVAALTVGTLQDFLDGYLARHPEAEVDYIHGEDSLCKLADTENAVGFLFNGMDKSELFPAVKADGALPRKTFSMGHARDKRYYIEARRIK